MANKTKKQDYNALSVEELKSGIDNAELHLRKLKYSHAVTPIDNPLSIKIARVELARMKTALTANK
jgi:large subunit ribosomal protein L29